MLLTDAYLSQTPHDISRPLGSLRFRASVGRKTPLRAQSFPNMKELGLRLLGFLPALMRLASAADSQG
jgi:hypothetical protein